MPTSERQLVTVAEAAARLSCSPRTIRRWIAQGVLPGYRTGPRLIRVDLLDVEQLGRPIPSARPSGAA